MSDIWQAAILSPPFSTLSYLPVVGAGPTLLVAGMRVLVPLGHSLRVALLLGLVDGGIVDGGIELRPVLWPMEQQPSFTAEYLELVQHLAARQYLPPGQVLTAFLPYLLRSASVYFFIYDRPRPRRLAPRELVSKLPVEVEMLEAMWQAGRMKMVVKGATGLRNKRLMAVGEPPWSLRPAAVRHLAVLDYLFGRGGVTRRQLIADLGPEAGPVLAQLITRGLVTVEPCVADADADKKSNDFEVSDVEAEVIETSNAASTISIPGESFYLNEAQVQVMAPLAEALSVALHSGTGCTSLLFGITGSGKTVIYLELAAACLAAGRSVLLLAPEMALAANLYAAAVRRFPVRRIFYHHSYQSMSHRASTFAELSQLVRDEAVTAGLASREPVLVVGTRSALFLPFPRLGLVVLDEEHDASFKQEERLPYQAKEVAWFRVHQAGALLVLGSATPDVKTFHAAQTDAVSLVRLARRVGESQLPEVELVDIRSQQATEQLLATSTIERLEAVVVRGEQAVILLNRRGYAPLMYCLDCGRVAQCQQCAIGLTYHKRRERLVCHYCGKVKPFPVICAQCGSCHYLPMGEGTERLEESLSRLLAGGVAVLRLDRDAVRKPGRMEEILASFRAGKAQVLVGTQMLSKGHHFPDVTLVIAADGDLGLNMPDYRAAERTFQLMVQASGRAGRGDKPGSVLIQTRFLGHYCWEFVRTGDYDGFYGREIAIREQRHYPPFIKLALIRVSYPLAWEQGAEAIAVAGQVIRTAARNLGVTAMGPAPAPLPLLVGRRRFHCLLKAHDWPTVREVYRRLLASGPHGELRITLDLDPVDML
ncbi:Primosomal protein N' [Desulfovibrionales bacterium]